MSNLASISPIKIFAALDFATTGGLGGRVEGVIRQVLAGMQIIRYLVARWVDTRREARSTTSEFCIAIGSGPQSEGSQRVSEGWNECSGASFTSCRKCRTPTLSPQFINWQPCRQPQPFLSSSTQSAQSPTGY